MNGGCFSFAIHVIIAVFIYENDIVNYLFIDDYLYFSVNIYYWRLFESMYICNAIRWI